VNWATRRGVHIDRAACAWLIHRFVDSDARFGNSRSVKLIEEMAKTFRGCDVVLNAIDIEGVRVQNDMSGARISSNDGLFLLARPTGGEVFHNSNDLGRDFAKMLSRQEVVYVIAFQAPTWAMDFAPPPESTAPAAFSSARPAWTARSRRSRSTRLAERRRSPPRAAGGKG